MAAHFMESIRKLNRRNFCAFNKLTVPLLPLPLLLLTTMPTALVSLLALTFLVFITAIRGIVVSKVGV